MKLIAPQSIAFTASVTENEIRERMAMEVLEQIGALDADGTALPNHALPNLWRIPCRSVRGLR